MGWVYKIRSIHTWRATLKRAAFNPISGGYAISTMVYMLYTAARYGTYDDHGSCGEPCSQCLEILQDVTAGAGMDWSPRSFEDGTSIRRLGKLCVDIFEEHGLVQEALSWFQHLISSGGIRIFDALSPIGKIDRGADWS
jgi:hypothetical protein